MGAPAAGWRGLPAHRAWLTAEAVRLLDTARRARVDHGFGWLGDDGEPDERWPPQLWITTRMTHCFALGDLLGVPGCASLADHGLDAVLGPFADRDHGGWVSDLGAPDGPKEAYPHAFVLLAAAGTTIAGRPRGPELLEAAGSAIERWFWAEDEGAVRESWDRAWQEPEAYRGANANMHMVEAMLAAGDATGDAVWARRALRIAERIAGVAREHGWRVVEHFDAAWRPLPHYHADQPRHPFRPFGVTPGHGLEWSRLLLQVAAALPSPPAWLPEAAQGLFARAVEDGWREPGAFVYTTGLDGEPVVRDRLHWVVCEAIGAAAALHDTTGDAGYETWYRRAWDVAAARFVDRRRGGWHHELDEALEPASGTWQGKPDAYHALQATLLPQLPVAPSVAGALRDHPLGS